MYYALYSLRIACFQTLWTNANRQLARASGTTAPYVEPSGRRDHFYEEFPTMAAKADSSAYPSLNYMQIQAERTARSRKEMDRYEGALERLGYPKPQLLGPYKDTDILPQDLVGWNGPVGAMKLDAASVPARALAAAALAKEEHRSDVEDVEMEMGGPSGASTATHGEPTDPADRESDNQSASAGADKDKDEGDDEEDDDDDDDDDADDDADADDDGDDDEDGDGDEDEGDENGEDQLQSSSDEPPQGNHGKNDQSAHGEDLDAEGEDADEEKLWASVDPITLDEPSGEHTDEVSTAPATQSASEHATDEAKSVPPEEVQPDEDVPRERSPARDAMEVDDKGPSEPEDGPPTSEVPDDNGDDAEDDAPQPLRRLKKHGRTDLMVDLDDDAEQGVEDLAHSEFSHIVLRK